jgi:uncharacterized protein YaeQ
MSFIDGFYRFSVDLNNSNTNIYKHLQFKVAKHPDESLEFLLKRVCVYLFNYKEGIELTQGLFDLKLPSIWARDVVENITDWVEVGLPDKKKIALAVKQNPKAKISIFFLTTEEINSFCHFLKGSTENWTKNISFYLLEGDDLISLFQNNTSGLRLTVNIFDLNMFIIDQDENNLTVDFKEVDIWEAYQTSIANNNSSI